VEKDQSIYIEKFPKGSKVRIKDDAFLESFRLTWKLHNPLEAEQLGYAGRGATVATVSFYHGGDVLYSLSGIPGIWHERCLEESDEHAA
jgi:hypothetical protein